jgi:hypothetical protein
MRMAWSQAAAMSRGFRARRASSARLYVSSFMAIRYHRQGNKATRIFANVPRGTFDLAWEMLHSRYRANPFDSFDATSDDDASNYRANRLCHFDTFDA